MKVLVTGANGFVGRAVVKRLVAERIEARAAVRRNSDGMPAGVEQVRVGDLDASTDWTTALAGVDAVVHASARVHVMHDSAADPLSEFRRVNVEGTLGLARAAIEAGVRRFIFISSIKVNGEKTLPGRPFTAADIPAPQDPYGISKLEAETALRELARTSGLEVVIIRPTLVYGAGVKGNFLSMLRWVERGVPLPLGAVDNRRSLTALDNLVDLVLTCLRHDSAPGHIFMVSDGRDLSTPELLRLTGRAVGRSARLIPIPVFLLQSVARLLGKSSVIDRLCGSLQVDISETQKLLSWHPPQSVEDALDSAASAFRGRSTAVGDRGA